MATNPLSMSDEDIMNMQSPPSTEVEGGSTAEQAPNTEETVEDTANSSEPNPEDKSQESETVDESVTTEEPSNESGNETDEKENQEQSESRDETDKGKEEKPKTETESGNEAENKEATEKGAEEAPKSETAKPTTDDKSDAVKETPPNYEEMYNKIMAPFKANGKEIKLNSPEEAIGLMQMGANYTKKMQELQPFRKILMMLQNNDLVDEDKLSFLIDINKKNPDAIHKLIKDSGVDPLTLDTESEPTYLQGSHKVSNEEVKFASTFESVGSTDSGRETLQIIKTWDDTSKELLWNHPEVMTIIHQQRELGVYQVIDAEVDRQVALGQIPPETPYLEAYKIAGDYLQANGGLPNAKADTVTTPADNNLSKPEPRVLEEKPAIPKPKVDNGEQANAAAPARSSPQKVETKINPLALSDDEFMKQFENMKL